LGPFPQVGQVLGGRDVRHVEGVLEARLFDLEAGGHVEYRLAVLDRHHPPRGERAAVTNAVDLVEDRRLGVAGAQEVGVQRVHVPIGLNKFPAVGASPRAARAPPSRWLGLERARGRHQRLPRHLAAEDALAILLG
jgi:hypothetical protein